jgi:dolichol-phosphate mannosyltransferase
MAHALTVIMPAYNEQEAIEAAVLEVQKNILDKIAPSELVVINDGSLDETGEILDRLSSRDTRIRVIHQGNGGHGSALLTGLEAGKGEFLFLMDSDQQIPTESFQGLWDKLPRYDAVFGVRKKRHDPALRLMLTRVIRLAIRFLFGVTLYDANAPFKLFRRVYWTQARNVIPSGTLAPSLFLAIYLSRQRIRFSEVEVPHRERTTGIVSIRRWKLAKFCFKAFLQLLQFRKKIKNGTGS